MGKFFNRIENHHSDFIRQQHIYFVATAPLSPNGRVNLSPKGLDSFKVISETQVAYADLISSGNETSAHTLENGRITFMFCSFDKTPNILKLYGKGFTVLRDTVEWDKYAPHFNIYTSTRQIIVANIDLVQTSCGFGVPMFDFVGDRDIHFAWAAKKGSEGLQNYILENNLKSLDGLPTVIGMQKEQ
jgi:Pyridoxamine 5'-phosphate oxidase